MRIKCIIFLVVQQVRLNITKKLYYSPLKDRSFNTPSTVISYQNSIMRIGMFGNLGRNVKLVIERVYKKKWSQK